MSDRLTFSWFVDLCNLGHPATGPQEALWNTVKDVTWLTRVVFRLSLEHLWPQLTRSNLPT